ncbi:hypothetical protein OH491_23185 [Termitidicoccus mucosus]|uniref:Uncharacterized protein n=1 Tax=Termitidicoccus mucosus TaxID=1184151 RepID=A0A178IPY8_9BACT|nr:hypothetical protein AW736_03285 [Opitutaceae bacterium TSB47]
MKKTNTNAFVSQMLVYSLLLIGLAGAGGVTAVWQRQAIAATANRIKQVEQQVVEADRRQAEVTAAVAAEQTLDALNRRNQQWTLGLAQVQERQIVRVDELPERRLAAKRNAEILAGRDGPAPDFNRNNSRSAATPAAQPVRYVLGGAR